MKKILSFVKKYVLILSLVVVLGITGAGIYLLKKINQETKTLKEEIRTKYAEAKKYEKEKEKAPSPELISRLTDEKQEWEKTFRVFLTKFSTSFPAPPTYQLFPSVEFKEFLFATEEYLDRKARRKKVTIPSSLGFPETGLPPADQVSALSLRLEVVKELIDLMIDAGVTVVTSITAGEPKSEAFYKVLPLQVGLTGTSIELVRFLKFLENPSSYFIVENFSLRQGAEGFFSADVTVNAIMLEVSKEAPPEEAKQRVETTAPAPDKPKG